MPRIHHDLSEFIRMWNAKRIRRQRQRTHVVSGKPYCLYFTPDPEHAQDCRIQLDQERLQLLQHILVQDGIDLDAFLPEETMQVCSQLMSELGGLPIIIPEEQRDSPYLLQFRQLLHALERYELAHPCIHLCLLQSPTGCHERLNMLLSQSGINLDLLEGEEASGVPDTSDDESDVE